MRRVVVTLFAACAALAMPGAAWAQAPAPRARGTGRTAAGGRS